MGQELEYMLIFATTLTIPKLLLRFKIPSGLTAMGLGVVFSQFDSTLTHNEVFKFLSLIGITSLFLFAGLEIDTEEMKSEKIYLTKYLTKFILVMAIIASAIYFLAGVEFKYACLIALALFTPSAGFILSSLHTVQVSEEEENWIKSKAISKEVVSILLLFFILQSGNPLMMLFVSAIFL